MNHRLRQILSRLTGSPGQRLSALLRAPVRAEDCPADNRSLPPGWSAGRCGGRSARRPETTGTILRGFGRALAATLLALAILGGMQNIVAAASYGVTITNVASVTYDAGTVLSNPVAFDVRSPATISFLKYAPNPGSGAPTLPVPATAYDQGGGVFVPIPQPAPTLNPAVPLLGGNPGDPPVNYYLGETAYLRVTDLDQNANPAAPDTIIIIVTCVETGDRETLRLTETDNDTGVFAGYLPTSTSVPAAADGRLRVIEQCHLQASYTDPLDQITTVTAAALIDPYGFIFDSATGEPVNGAQVTLINVATGGPALVYGDDGVSIYQPDGSPTGSATVLTGGTATDAGGIGYQLPPGGFRFPYILPGTYRLVVTPPNGWLFPSSAENSQLLAVRPGAVLVVGSRGENFAVNPGPALRIDIPIDPLMNYLWLQKFVSDEQATTGDFLQYRLELENISEQITALDVSISDRLPLGFRYQKGSTRIAGERSADPEITADGRTMTFRIGNLPPQEKVAVTYVVEVAAGAKPGKAVNLAQAHDRSGVHSNRAKVAVEVREPFFRDKTFLIGRILSGACNEEDTAMKGLAGVRIYLEDGTYAVTDDHGRYHFEGVEPGTHVVQVDQATLPTGFEMIPCAESSQSAGRTFSRFVDLKGGTLWQVNFHAAPLPPSTGEVTLQLFSTVAGEGTALRVVTKAAAVPVDNLRLTLMLPGQSEYLPGSAHFNGESITDPLVIGGTINLRAAHLDAGQTAEFTISFRLADDPAAGVLPAKALLTFDTPAARNQRTPLVENRLQPEGATSSSVVQSTATTGAKTTADDKPARILPPPAAREPEMTPLWLSALKAEPAIVWPEAGSAPEIPSTAILIQHPRGSQVALRLNGEDVSRLSFDTIRPVPNTPFLVSSWAGVDLLPGRNLIEAELAPADGALAIHLQREVWYITLPEKLEWFEGKSTLAADGIHPPTFALRLTDRDGHPLHPGQQIEYRVSAPHRPLRDDRVEDTLSSSGVGRMVTGADGLAYAQLEPTTQAGEVTVSLLLPGAPLEIKAWLTPAARDWILVGFAEGTAGHTTISKNMVSAADAGIEEDSYTDGRVKFFAKGAIKGDWLLTLAYDSDKPELDGDSLHQIIDPDTYYPLYGDGTQQGYEAASARDIYVKLERNQFYALFGDMQTNLTQAELSKYVRSLNGFKSELQSEHFDYTVFAAETRQGFAKDEIRGDGTSGRYTLSRKDLVINSEQVTIETRDRFHHEVILKEESLARHADYDIDYDAGTLWFKRPVPSKDGEFNPIFIVVRYETGSSDEAHFNYGGRAAVKFLDQKIEVGATHVHEEDGRMESELTGADLTVKLTQQTTLRTEVATTSVDEVGQTTRNGDAWLAEVVHQGEQLAARSYIREQGESFGLGQQNGGDGGMRTYGVDGTWRITPQWSVAGELYRQENLATAATRDVGEAEVRYRTETFGLMTGVREARDRFENGDTQRSSQILMGGDVTLFKRLTLRTTHEQSLMNSDENADFPTRTLLGTDFRLTRNLSLFAEQEFTNGSKENTQGTRVGFKSTPWSGGTLTSAVERERSESGERMFALFGLGQNWQVSEHWSVGASLDRSYTLKHPGNDRINVNVPQASGSDEDFTAVSAGATYRADKWSWTNRLEHRESDSEEKIGVSSGLVGEVREGLAASARLMAFLIERGDGSRTSEEEVTLGLAWRPDKSRWIVLERLDLEIDNQNAEAGGNDSWRVVNHLHASYRPNWKWQTSAYYGLKYVRETFDGDRYDGFTDLLALETRYNIGKRWDVGANGATLHSWNSNQLDYSAGASVGFQALTNTWISAGYNFAGFEDDDFSAANYTAAGPYVKFRMKFDQQTVKEALEWFGK